MPRVKLVIEADVEPEDGEDLEEAVSTTLLWGFTDYCELISWEEVKS